MRTERRLRRPGGRQPACRPAPAPPYWPVGAAR